MMIRNIFKSRLPRQKQKQNICIPDASLYLIVLCFPELSGGKKRSCGQSTELTAPLSQDRTTASDSSGCEVRSVSIVVFRHLVGLLHCMVLVNSVQGPRLAFFYLCPTPPHLQCRKPTRSRQSPSVLNTASKFSENFPLESGVPWWTVDNGNCTDYRL